jgi:hypothetical protein
MNKFHVKKTASTSLSRAPDIERGPRIGLFTLLIIIGLPFYSIVSEQISGSGVLTVPVVLYLIPMALILIADIICIIKTIE